ELARMISRAGLKFTSLPDEDFDNPLGIDTGAAVIFGATGGVMEAALRTANDVLTGKDNENVEFHEVRGTEGLKEATYTIAGIEIKVAVASGAANAKLVMDKIASGEADWTFVEIMGCPGGCVNGGGQPIQPQYVRDTVDLKAVRASALYAQDEASTLRKSHLNPVVKEVYDNYFKGGYGCHAAHHILHTSYVARKKFNI
ncbi:MAG: iron hydrogenase small subunit, partial [Clostridia bacterium]|nr:iron hydrogenase small subunit [Clostridia bacterium]